MSLLNDALRKNRNETETQKDVHLAPEQSVSYNAKKLKLLSICLLLLLFGSMAFGGWYFLSPLFAQVDSPLAAVGPPKNDKVDQSNSILKPNLNNKKEIASYSEMLKPVREFTPLQYPVETKKNEKKRAAEKSHGAKAPLPLPKKDVQKPISVKKKPPLKSTQQKDRSAPSHQAGLFFRKALRYHRQGRLKSAIQMYRQVLSVKPDHQDAMFNLASAYIQLASYSEAYPLLKELRRRDFGNPEILINLAIVELGLENPAKALELLDMAEKQSNGPKFEIYFHRAAALSRLGRLEEARISYKKAHDLNPRHPTLFFNIAVLCDKLHKYNEAVEYYRAFLRHNDKLSHPEKKNVEARIRSLQVYLAGVRN